jgi:hypothetical protein
MKRMIVAALAIIGAATPAAAGAPTVADVSKAVTRASWDECIASIDTMLRSGTPPLTQVTIRSGSSLLEAGSYALTELRSMCVRRYIPLGVERLGMTADVMLDRGARLEEAYDTNIDAATDMTARCRAGVERLLAVGAAPDTPVMVGTATFRLDEVDARLCSQGDALITAANQRFMGKYRGVLTDDKLALIERSPIHGYLAVPPGESSSDPKVLARARLWFETSSRQPRREDRCSTTIHTYRRFQFDAKHRLVKRSQKEYCGDPGPRALR